VNISISHRTVYRFDGAVFLEPHVVRLRPREDATSRLVALTLEIDPPPAMRAEYLDPEGNVVTQAWFEGTTERLAVESHSTVETLVTDPFRFLLEDPERTLPDVYPKNLRERLSAYCAAPDSVAPAVREFALAVADSVGRRQDRFPWALTDRIHRDYRLEVREHGPPNTPDDTLRDGRGACRDLAVLFMECSRAMGLAARFVSGYAYVGGETDHELHGWAEIYIPGGGWRGYDPTMGLAVADRHVAVAAAANPLDAAPVSGSFRGSVAAALETVVDVTSAPVAEQLRGPGARTR